MYQKIDAVVSVGKVCALVIGSISLVELHLTISIIGVALAAAYTAGKIYKDLIKPDKKKEAES